MSEEEKNVIEVQLKALDDIVAVNSLFTIAIFVGLSLASPNQHSLEGRQECDADPGMAQRLVLYEVVSFALFLLSSLAAKTCKVVLNARLLLDRKFQLFPHNRDILLSVSGIASFAGIVLLTLSMVNVVQIKIGKLSCGSTFAIHSVVYLCLIVLVALLIYGIHMFCAVWYCLTREKWLHLEHLKEKLSHLDKRVGVRLKTLMTTRLEAKEKQKEDKKKKKKTDPDADADADVVDSIV